MEPGRTCEICKAPMETELQDYIVMVDDEEVTVEDVPIWVCPQCGHTHVEEEVIEAIEDMLEHLDTVSDDDEED